MGYRKALVGGFTTLASTAVLLGALSVTAGAANRDVVVGRSAAAKPASRVASTPAGAQIRFMVGLKLTNEASALAFAREVSTPGNALYRHYLTPAQFERRFSPPSSAVASVSHWLTSLGITITSVSPARLTIYAEGSAAAVGAAFDVGLAEYREGASKVRLASGSLTVPSGVASLIDGVAGVNEQLAKHASLAEAPGEEPGSAAALAGESKSSGATTKEEEEKQLKEEEEGHFKPAEGFKNAPPCSGYFGEKPVTGQAPFGTMANGYPRKLTWAPCGYVPAQLRGAYSIPESEVGSGQSVAIVDAFESPTLFEDAQKYSEVNEQGAVLSKEQFTIVPPPGGKFDVKECGGSEGASGWAPEQSLDVEAVHAMAPAAHIVFMAGASCSGPSLDDAVETVIVHHLASVISDSWLDNDGELIEPKNEREAFDKVLAMGAATGVGVQFSSGDEGSNFKTLGMNVPYYPAVSPWATAVGGTSLEVGAENNRIGETGWSTSRSFLCSALLEELLELPGCTKFTRGRWDPPAPGEYDYGGGGGTSYYYPEPAYQEKAVPASLAARNTPITGMFNRVVPDISMEGDPSTGLKIGETQQFASGVAYGEYRLGGTSLSSPLLAGVMADADQAAGGSLGFANPLLYQLAYDSTSPYGTPGAIYDVLPAGKQAIERNDYLLPAAEAYVYTTARTLGYEGPEEFCSGTGECESQDVILHATPGFDSMTGIGSPGPEFVQDAASVKVNEEPKEETKKP